MTGNPEVGKCEPERYWVGNLPSLKMGRNA
jgi:hypothetical protein